MYRRFLQRCLAHFRKSKLEREMEAEMRFHLEMEIAENIRRGMSEAEARLTAQRSFGGFEQTKENYRDVLRFRWLEDLWQDLHYGVRTLRNHRGFTGVAVLTLALGIGVTTAIFTVVNGVLIRSLPYHDPARLVLIGAGIMVEDPYSEWSPWGWRNRVQSFEQVAAFGGHDGGINLSIGTGEAERIEALDVSANFFETLGVHPVVGRFFAPEHERPGNQAFAVISTKLWQQRFEGKMDVIGKSLQLNGKSFTIIGVAPPEVQYPKKTDVWVPIFLGPLVPPFLPLFTSPSAEIPVFGRLKSDVTLAAARAEMKAYSERVKLDHTIDIESLMEELVGQLRQSLLLLMAAVGFVLLIACANVANLLLARSATRRRELAVRAALGAGRSRLMRQSLTESLLIGVLGGLAGLLLAVWLHKLFLAFSPPEIPRLHEITLDYRVLAFNATLALLTGVLVGLLPAMQGSKGDMIEALKDDVQKVGAGANVMSVKSALIVGEIALSLILLIGAGLLLRSLTKVLATDAGFDRENVLSVSLALPLVKYREAEKFQAFYQRLIEQVSVIPGVKAVGATTKLPLSREDSLGVQFTVVGEPKSRSISESYVTTHWISADYFNAMGISLLHGRAFTEADRAQSPSVIIINETLARRVFPNGNALGKRLKLSRESSEIIGVVSAVRSVGLETAPQQEIYLPYLQAQDYPPTALAIRTVGDPLAVTAAVREAIRQLDETLPPYDIKTLGQRVFESVARRRFLVSLMSIFALLALVLAATGIYGVMSYLVAQRTREIGIRLALGATTGDVLKLILKQALLLILLGTTLGLAGALALTRLIKFLLYGVSATEMSVFVSAALLLVLTALFAAYLPGRRATKVDPMVALRCE